MKIVIDGEPIAQTRMRFSGRNGFSRVYDPRAKDKDAIKKLIKAQFLDHMKFEHPRVSFIFHMPIPKSTPKKLLPLYQSGTLKHEKKSDTDNFLKLYLDCLDTIVFEGDQKVSLGDCVKLYHPHPKTIIIIQETTQIITPPEVDPLTWQALFSLECGKCSFSEILYLPDSYTPDFLAS